MALLVKKPSLDIVFPRTEAEVALRSWWRANSSSTSRLRSKDAREKGGTVFDIQPEVSSQDAVEVLLELETVIGFEPPTSMIKRGGYSNVNEFVEQLLPQLEKHFSKKK